MQYKVTVKPYHPPGRLPHKVGVHFIRLAQYRIGLTLNKQKKGRALGFIPLEITAARKSLKVGQPKIQQYMKALGGEFGGCLKWISANDQWHWVVVFGCRDDFSTGMKGKRCVVVENKRNKSPRVFIVNSMSVIMNKEDNQGQ